jgi:catechol 2,3-dioxygenase-like lactoylglutathione lyase family enzyme
MSVQRLSHLGICVSDLARAVGFYRDALGFAERGPLEVAGEPAARLLGLPELKLRAVYLERDGVRIELLHYVAPGALGDGTPRPMNALGLSHLSLRVADLDRAVEAVLRAGGRLLAASRIALPAARTRAVFVTDPDGTRLELVEAPGDPAALPGSSR